MSKKILVTGAAGLIGSQVVKELISRKYEVIAVDNFSYGDNENDNSLVTWVKEDITKSNFENIFNELKPTGVIHCAAHPGGESLQDPVLDVEVNILGSIKLFYQAALAKTPIVYLSSSAVYGPSKLTRALKENDELNPGTIYAACKVACENYLKILEKGYGLKWTILRLFATYGPGHKGSNFQGIVNIMLTQLLKGNKVVVKGSLQRVRGLIYVNDAAFAIVNALENEKSRSQIINISHQTPSTIQNIIKILMQHIGKEDARIIEEEGTVGDPMYNYADITKSKEILNFEPKYSLEDGLKELVDIKLGK
jgi:UDP-glucose 4-epimerase